jgi:sodium/potassium-transporting ATPase subunit beta
MGNEGETKTAAGPAKFKFYDSDTGELLGRTGGSWAKIGLFYIAYFCFLAGLFTASIQIMKTSINLEKPKLQTRLNIPGLHFFPKANPMASNETSRIKDDNKGVAFFWDSSEESSRKFYTDLIKTEVVKYNKMSEAKSAAEDVTDFDWSSMGDCGFGGDNLDAATFGWDTNTPCIYLRLNRIIDWKPVGLFKPADGTIFAADGPKKPMVEDAVYMRCKSKYIGDKEDDDVPTALTFTYFGGNGDGYVEKKFFPYGGKAAQPNYQSPIVALKVNGLEDGDKHRVTCQAHAANIVVDTRDGLGHIQFEIQHKGEAVKTE